jgi:hypothetical protein
MGAVQFDADTGITDISARVSLVKTPRLGGVAAAAGVDDDTPSQMDEARNDLELSGILNFLFEAGHLNHWSPAEAGRRSYDDVSRRLLDIAVTTTVNRNPLSKTLFIPRPYAQRGPVNDFFSNDYPEFVSILQAPQPNGGRRCMLFVGEVLAAINKTGVCRLDIEGHDTGLPLTDSMLQKVSRRYRNAYLAINRDPSKRARVWVIALVSHARDELVVEEISLLLTNGECVPSESQYEVDFITKAVDEGRCFYKPMRRHRKYEILFDLIFTDTGFFCPAEVWGMHSEEYDQRKEEKIAYCKENDIPLVQWNAVDGDPMPEFPPPALQ